MVNDTSKPLIFLGASQSIAIYIECCEHVGIQIAGIIDGDYYGNTATIENVAVIDGHDAFSTPEKIAYYRENFNFFCAVNWLPVQDEISIRGRKKRQDLIGLAQQHNL
jgi:hypothetical protein